MSKRLLRVLAVLVAFTFVAAACGDDDDDDAGGDAGGDTTTTAAADGGDAGADTGGDAAAVDLDTNGDGTVLFGVATPGPRDDGAYYQALVEGVEGFAADNGYAEPIIVDEIAPADAETELRNLAAQNVDVIAVGAGELSDPLAGLVEEFPDIFWYCNCGAGYPDTPGLAQAGDDSSEISYSAGYATGLLMQESGATKAAFLGCCDLDFEQEAFNAFGLGLAAVDESFEWTYIPTGDFNDQAAATEAFNQALADGVGAVYPFLGGSHETVVGLANENDVIVMSAGASDACDRTDVSYDIAVQFDAGDYLATLFAELQAGNFREGERFVFNVGEFDFVGAKFCDATDEQVAALDEVRAQILNGDFTDQFFEIKSEAYGF